MSSFRTPLVFQDDNGFPYTLVQPLSYESTLLAGLIVVPSGFKTDLASIPRGLWNILPKSGKYDRAAVIHDFLYQTNRIASRAQADAVLNEAMAVCEVPTWQRWIIYSAVRLGGGSIWNRYRTSPA